ncbi:unnamed protein product [Peronospora belbahrii]|uniref:SPX domain-containing protein n=1 Tax=Peronospora belbahrii TaxID=622444 RepID=A0AAU9KNP4_9STRA|nr:unnamed protein product [Peronospora belbahrii]
MSTPVDTTLNPPRHPVDSSCDPVRPLNPPLIALPPFLDEHITASFRKKVALNGKIKAKRVAIQKLKEHDANGTCPKLLQISHTMTFSDSLRESDSEFVQIQSEHFEEIKCRYLKQATAIALKVQHKELKTLNIKFGNLDTEFFNKTCEFFDSQQTAAYPTVPLTKALVVGMEVGFCGRYSGEFHFPYLIELAKRKYCAKWSEYLDGLNERLALMTIKAKALETKRVAAEDTEMGLPDEAKIKDLVSQVADAKFKKLESMIRSMSSPNPESRQKKQSRREEDPVTWPETQTQATPPKRKRRLHWAKQAKARRSLFRKQKRKAKNQALKAASLAVKI